MEEPVEVYDEKAVWVFFPFSVDFIFKIPVAKAFPVGVRARQTKYKRFQS